MTRTTTEQVLILRQDAGSCLDQLWNNRGVESILVAFDGPLTDEEYFSVFRSLAHLPHMTKLRVCQLKNSLPVKALSAVINDPGSQLCHVTLEHVRLSGKFRDYMAFVESLRLCSLQSIELDHCEFVDQTISLNPLIRALTTIPTLERVSLERTKVAPEGTSWDCRYLEQLVIQIRSLTLNQMSDIQYPQVCVLAKALEDPSCALKELVIQDQPLCSKSIQRIAKMLETNASLEELTLELDCAEAVGVIARSLQRQHTGGETEKGRSSKLRHLSFPGDWGQQHEDFYSKVRQDLLKMVQTNILIANLFLGDETSDLCIEMATYIKMNMSHRQAILCSDDKSTTTTTTTKRSGRKTTEATPTTTAAARILATPPKMIKA